MRSVLSSPRRPPRLPLRERGQALVFGVVVVLGAALATFFVFNTGQLTAEKTKLVNTADAVAYSAGLMHARALNFDAYTNRALLANEATIAQMVSISSWLDYSQQHAENVPPLECYYAVSIPTVLMTLEYAPLCYALSYTAGYLVVKAADTAFNGANVGMMTVAAAEVAKKELKGMQSTMFAGFLFARSRLMQEVADANYRNEGSVAVDAIPLKDNWSDFDGGPFIGKREGDQRARMRDAIRDVVNRDDFVRERRWSSDSPWPCEIAPIGEARRSGGTRLNGYDSWEANDRASFRVRSFNWNIFDFGCKTDASYGLGNASLETTSTEGAAWYYSGVPDFYELSDAALGYTPADPDKHDPRLQLAVRLTRAIGQTRTSAGTSAVKPGGRLQVFDGGAAGNVLAAVATSEVFFDHQREDGATELASLFNPFWQVRMVNNSAAVTAAATARQGTAP